MLLSSLQSKKIKSFCLAKTCLYGALLLFASSLYAATTEENKEEKLPLLDLQKFTRLIDYVKEYYVNAVDDNTLFENAMRGMLSGLDPHSMYFNKEEFTGLKENTTGKFGGLGIEFLPEDGFLRVIAPIDNTPAEKAGIQSGDLIIKLNDTPVQGLSTREIVETMRGEKGTQITLTIIRQSEEKPIKVTLTRDTINTQSIRTKTLDDQFAYVRISLFQSNSGTDLTRAIQNFKKTNNKLKGIILDLRNNPGGVVDAAVQVADVFLDKDHLKQYDGVIVYSKGRTPGSQMKQKAHPGDMLNGAPIVVLINNGSASASEIVAGALQDYHRAVIVGHDSFGKGTMQLVIPLKDDCGLKLTTALYYTPAGRSIQATGIKPDIAIPNLKIPTPSENDQLNSLMIREQDLQGHLANGNDKKPTVEQSKVPVKEAPANNTALNTKNLIYTDYQLYEAFNILKGLAFANETQEQK